MGLWDSLFGKKVTIQGHDENGKPFETEVSEKQRSFRYATATPFLTAGDLRL